MNTLSEETQLAISVLASNILASYFEVSSVAMLIYDHSLTVGLELSLVWPAPWSLGKVLYFLTAYAAFVDSGIIIYMLRPGAAFSAVVCTRVFKANIWILVSGISFAESVLVYRTWAIWGRTRKSAIIYSAAWAAAVVVVFVIIERSMQQVQLISGPLGSSKCIRSKGLAPIAFVGYLLFTIVESLILGLTVYIARDNLRWGTSTLSTTLYKDGILYYVYLLGFSVANIAMFFSPLHNTLPLAHIHRILHTILIKRVLLNLRDAASRDSLHWSPSRPFVTDISFADPDQ